MRAAGSRKDGGEGGLSEQTMLHHHRLLHRIFAHAVYWQYLVANPVSRVPAPRVTRKAPKEVAAVLEEAKPEE